MAFDQDTGIGGPSAKFPHTRHSAILSTRSDDPAERGRAYAALATSYWKPAYKYIRVHWRKSNEDAKDLTQTFFALAVEKNYFRNFQPGRVPFRSYLRTCLDGFVANQNEAASRLKRGGGTTIIPLDFENAEGELQALPIPGDLGTEEMFYREWVRHLFSTALERLRAQCEREGKTHHFLLLERYDIDHTARSYAEMAGELGLPVTTVTNHLAWARRTFRHLVLEILRESTGSEAEFQSEAIRLLGTAIP